MICVDKNNADGNFYGSKMFRALGNYRRYVRPGAVRIGVTVDDNDILVSGFKDATGGKPVPVMVNRPGTDKPLSLTKATGTVTPSQPLVTCTTSETKSLAKKTVKAREPVAPGVQSG